MPKPIQRVKFTKAIARHTKIRDQNPSLGYICPGEPHQRSPSAPKFEDRSPEETEWQEQGAREAAWKLAKNVLKLKEHERATFFSPSENNQWNASIEEPLHTSTAEKSERPEQNRDLRCQSGPSAKDSVIFSRQSSNARQLGCVFQDMKPPKSILRKCTDMPKPIHRVKFTKAIARHTKIRDQNPSLGYICPGEPHERSPNAPKFEDRSLEETEWQEQGAREAAWKLAKNVLKLKEHERATFFSPSENRCLPPSNLKPEEREFVVDFGASMHMISKKDISDAEIGYFDEIVQSYDSHNRQWRSANA